MFNLATFNLVMCDVALALRFGRPTPKPAAILLARRPMDTLASLAHHFGSVAAKGAYTVTRSDRYAKIVSLNGFTSEITSVRLYVPFAATGSY